MRLAPAHRRSARPGHLPMTSMIDVVFLLLIFFMVTANFSQDEERLPAALQADGKGASTQDLQPQVLRVRPASDGVVYLIGSREIDTRGELVRVLRALPKDQGVIIRVADEAPIWAAAAAIQSAADAGFEKRTYVPGLPTE